MKVLFEMLSLLENPAQDDENTNQNTIIQKLISDSRLYLEVFVDLIKFASA